MIIDENLLLAKQTHYIKCQCDFCGNEFERKKHIIIRSHKTSLQDACKKCTTKKRQMTFLTKFNGNPMSQQTIKDKFKKTCNDKYGCDNPFQNEEVKNKIKEANLKNLGVAYPSQLPTTNFKTNNPMKSKITKDKFKKTCNDKYGCDNPFQNEEVKNKIKETNLKNYGVENPSQSKDIQDKREKTFIKNYGYNNPFSSPEIRETIRHNNIAKYGHPYPPHHHKTQDAIKDWLNSFGFNFQSTYDILKTQELDLYDSNLKIAFEYCGIYWHSEFSPTPRGRNYHFDKYKECSNAGIRLITIFSDEWVKRQLQCKNFIQSALKINQQKLYARNCQIEQLSRKDFNQFVEEHHIQGKNNLGLVFFGLKHKGILVGAMSLGNHPRSKLLTLDRLCFKNNIYVIGGSDKLFNQCKIWAADNSIVSYSDNRWSQGQVYTNLGFTLEKEILPDYSYVALRDCEKRLSKQSQSKNKTNCPDHLKEVEWAKQRGLSRIWDCGKKRWLYKKERPISVT